MAAAKNRPAIPDKHRHGTVGHYELDCCARRSSLLTTMTSNYESLHRQCRTLESLFDSKLTSYSRLASTISRTHDDVEAEGSRDRWKDVEMELDELLAKVRSSQLWYCCMMVLTKGKQLEETNEQLSSLSNNAEAPLSQSMMRAIQRHRDVFQDQSREFRRTKAWTHYL